MQIAPAGPTRVAPLFGFGQTTSVFPIPHSRLQVPVAPSLPMVRPLDSVELSSDFDEWLAGDEGSDLADFFPAGEPFSYPGGIPGGAPAHGTRGICAYPGAFDPVDQALSDLDAQMFDGGPLTVTATPADGCPVTSIEIQSVDDPGQQVESSFSGNAQSQQSATLGTAQPGQRYAVSVRWANGSTYDDVVDDVGAVLVTQPG